ncbi:MAG: Heterodisulfide reductase [Candidatus Alkanophagales archaeon MCA70_species_2]|nr:Heterodisulfide reductase [Candidatus Alkanophaga liquidiphilum]
MSAELKTQVVVVGGGVAGLSASLALANSGIKVCIIEKGKLGGHVARLAECLTGLNPLLMEARLHENIEIVEKAELKGVEGAEGNFRLKLQTSGGEEREVVAERILLTTGYETATPERRYRPELKNVLTSLEFEDLISGCGELEINGRRPRRIGFVQCVGSRCKDFELCSAACCAYTAKEVWVVKSRYPDAEVFVFYMDVRTFGRDDKLVERLKNAGVKYIRTRVAEVLEHDGKLVVRYEEGRKTKELELDMLVLAVGLRSTGIAGRFGVETNEFGFVKADARGRTSVSGIFAGGAAIMPLKVEESVITALAAAAEAAKGLERGKEGFETLEKGRGLGVVVCDCGGEIPFAASIVEFTRRFGDVRMASSCEGAVKAVKELAAERRSILFVGCSPRFCERLLKRVCARSGLDPSFLEIVNVREGCAWVGGDEKMARELVRLGIERLGFAEVKSVKVSVVKKALVVGGGPAGLSAAATLSELGFDVCLVEKEEIGGMLNRLRSVGDRAAAEVLSDLKRRIEGVEVRKGEVLALEGTVGNFVAHLSDGSAVEAGVVIVATGVSELPQAWKAESVMTLLDFEYYDDLEGRTVAMLLCAEREKVGYCSKLCCLSALKNALRARNAGAEVFVFYEDIKAYGHWELLYNEAREKGVVFIKSGDVKFEDGVLTAFNEFLGDYIELRPDVLVLCLPLVPNAVGFKLPTEDGFVVDSVENPSLRLKPLVTLVDGVFVCGSAAKPRTVEECVVSGAAAALRALEILSKDALVVQRVVSVVDERACSGCGVCESVCPNAAISLEERKVGVSTYGTVLETVVRVSHVDETLCKGCGACVAACPSGAVAAALKDETLLRSLDILLS